MSSTKKSCQRRTAMEKVMGNDDLLTEILVRLPPKSICKCRYVSRRWRNIIASPHFLQNYKARENAKGPFGGRLLAFFQKNDKYCHGLQMKIFPISGIRDHTFKKMPLSVGDFIHYAGGLILCSYKNSTRYRVVNPLTRSWIKLPRPHSSWLKKLGLMVISEENVVELAPNFIVVGVHDKGRVSKTMWIETYHSKTDEWIKSKLIANEKFRLHCHTLDCFSFNGVFHWHANDNKIVVYDPKGDGNHLQVIEGPPENETYYDFTLTRSSNDDVIWAGTHIRYSFNFWMLPKDDNGTATILERRWILMHTIDLNTLFDDVKMLALTVKRNYGDGDINEHRPDQFKLEALIPWNPVVAVISLRRRVLFCNLESRLLELVHCRGQPNAGSRSDGLQPYMEPLSLSTYGLSGETY